MPMPPTPKIAVAVRDDLATWQKLNVVAFLTSGIGTDDPSLIGEPYEDADGYTYLRMLGHPVIVLSGDGAALRRGLRRARERKLATAVYIEPMFTTATTSTTAPPCALSPPTTSIPSASPSTAIAATSTRRSTGCARIADVVGTPG